jgi:hypothetical protein
LSFLRLGPYSQQCRETTLDFQHPRSLNRTQWTATNSSRNGRGVKREHRSSEELTAGCDKQVVVAPMDIRTFVFKQGP